ncbi:hypothetical protein STAS_24882, partial [Striga asiatica]
MEFSRVSSCGGLRVLNYKVRYWLTRACEALMASGCSLFTRMELEEDPPSMKERSNPAKGLKMEVISASLAVLDTESYKKITQSYSIGLTRGSVPTILSKDNFAPSERSKASALILISTEIERNRAYARKTYRQAFLYDHMDHFSHRLQSNQLSNFRGLMPSKGNSCKSWMDQSLPFFERVDLPPWKSVPTAPIMSDLLRRVEVFRQKKRKNLSNTMCSWLSV